ncbi:RES domain protein [Pseudomonas sp. THAF187a]|uniref:RES family NAD+ phosphorylase n=1 Tax=Ectopseudomonas khazarica TaxID=2502979 RepID=A0ABW7MHK8_9GAMM|nr:MULTISPECIES: RES family NAD+ phosphorylase [unclassified Pseudomonas]QFT23408.1 RES domain protein [Pseudomonas sp. THAF187a]QFT43596.1 RES domain protein [Pseudomonas sp. THAF42]|tara:strand:- start:17388 stop:18140 length:753 start_codon:yes stop_codon:yes gene_type:complete
MDIWQQCAGERQVRPLRGKLLRMVESQAQVATSQLVDNLAEQALLEDLLENSKPPLPEAAEPLHYLLKTPFRYPPLRWGSRFGTVHEPSLFYAAQHLQTAMAEAAYYRFVLWNGMLSPPPSGRILSEHSTFEARYRVERGIQLQLPPFDAHAAQLAHPSDYSVAQRLGAAMRAADIQAFEYRSARCPAGGSNVALYVPQAFAEKRPRNLTAWLCETTGDYVAFKPAQVPGQPRLFRWEQFLVQGQLPHPA